MAKNKIRGIIMNAIEFTKAILNVEAQLNVKLTNEQKELVKILAVKNRRYILACPRRYASLDNFRVVYWLLEMYGKMEL